MSRNRFTARTVLPIPNIVYRGLPTDDAKNPDAKFSPITPLKPSAGAPNVLIMLLDDVEFGASSTSGGWVNTPTAERLAACGLKHTHIHATALCSLTRSVKS